MRTSGILMHISSLPSPGGIGTLGKEAYDFAEKLRSDIENANNDVCPVTISIGFTKYANNVNYHKIIEKADQALYYAKEHGRNKVVNYDDI